MKRKHIPLKEKLASALYEIERLKVLLPGLDNHQYPRLLMMRAKGATAKSVCSLYHWDHNIYHAHSGSDTWGNITPRLIREHVEKTKVDLGIIAKSKRIRRKEAEHKVMLPSFTEEIKAVASAVRGWRKRKLASRPFPKAARKLKKVKVKHV